MSTVVKVSEASSLALHAAVLLAESTQRPQTVGQMAAFLGASEAHLAKVMQRLARAGLVRASRGPAGGFVLARPADEVKLLEVFESIEGPLTASDCLLGKPVCVGQRCMLGGLLQSLSTQARDYFSSTTLAAMAAEGAGALTPPKPRMDNRSTKGV